jgi:hypothetical protein
LSDDLLTPALQKRSARLLDEEKIFPGWLLGETWAINKLLLYLLRRRWDACLGWVNNPNSESLNQLILCFDRYSLTYRGILRSKQVASYDEP